MQTYSADKLVTKWSPVYWENALAKTQDEIFSQLLLFKEGDYNEFFQNAKEVGITLLSTPFDLDSAVMFDRCRMEADKFASADFTFHALLKK